MSLVDNPLIRHWDRLEVLDLKGPVPWINTPERSAMVVYLCRPSLDRRRVVRLHPSSFSSFLYHDLPSVVKDILLNRHILDLKLMQEESVVLVVGSEKEKEQVEEAIQKEGGEWKSKLAVELGAS